MPTSDTVSASPPRPPRRGISLANLFLLVTVCGVLAANLMPVMETARKTNSLGALVPWSLAGAVIGMVLGIPIGLCQRRPWLGLGLAIPLGLLVGAVTGPMSILPPERFGGLIRISLGGGAALVVFAIVARRFGQ
jgi:hypothetical protein